MGMVRHVAPSQALVIENSETGEKIKVQNISARSVRLRLTGPMKYKFYEAKSKSNDLSYEAKSRKDQPNVDASTPEPTPLSSIDPDNRCTGTHELYPYVGG